MIKKMLIFVIVLAVLLPMALPSAAQEEVPLLFEINTLTEVPALGFNFLSPDGWVSGESPNGDGIVLAETQADLDAELDADDATKPVGYTISVRYLPLDLLGLEPTVTTQEVADILVQQAGLTINESFDYPVLGRHSVFINGMDAEGDLGFANVWVQDGQLVFFGFGLPDGGAVVDETYYTWGYVLGSALYLADSSVTPTEPFSSAQYGSFEINGPEGWTTGTDSFNNDYIMQFAEDVDLVNNNQAPTGIGLMWGPIGLDTFGLTAESTADDLRQIIETNNPDVVLEEYMFFNNVGFGIPYLDGSYIITGLKDGELYFFILFTPSQKALAANKGALLNMMMSIKSNQ